MNVPAVIIFKKLHVKGMALYPFILLREKEMKEDRVIMNHERIHHRQQLELFIVPFYLLYLINYVWNRLRFRTHREAYLNIIFEREAYSCEHDLNYLGSRRRFAFLKFINKESMR